jgi:UDP-GlcNAc:undecaprenyl-phosphate/decaprenyl-phosphate GlcNAc-1-phosphate transferase
VVGIVVAFAVALVWCLLSLWLGPALGFVDRPDDLLKTHRTPAVPLGGVGVVLGVLAGTLVEGFFSPWLAAAMVVLLVLGLVDDRSGLDPRLRLVVEAGAGALLAVGGVPSGFGPVERVAVVILVVAAVNAVNLFDGLDGLLGSVAVVTGVALYVLGSLRGVDAVVPLLLAATCAGVLVLNWHPARVFFGDNGAYVVGLLLVFGMAAVSAGGETGSRLTVAAFLLGVPAFDLVVALLRRRLAGAPLFIGDRSHLYDQLHDRGVPIRSVALLAAAAQAVWAAAVIGVDALLGGWAAVAVLAVLAVAVLAGLGALGFIRPDKRLAG